MTGYDSPEVKQAVRTDATLYALLYVKTLSALRAALILRLYRASLLRAMIRHAQERT